MVQPQKAFGESGGSCQMVEETLASGTVRVLGVLQDSSHHRGCLSPVPPSNTSPGYSVKRRNFIYIKAYNLVPFYLEVQSKACTGLICSKLSYLVSFGISPGVVHQIGKSPHDGNNTQVPLLGVCVWLPCYRASEYGHGHIGRLLHILVPLHLHTDTRKSHG